MFIKKKYILIFIVVSFTCSVFLGCSNEFVSQSGDRIDMWTKDIDYLAKELPKRHKNLFFKLTEEEFSSEIKNLKESLSKMNDDEIQIGIRKIVASLGDTHTSTNIGSNKVFPLELYWFKDGFYVINTSQEYKDIMYSKLKGVNGMDIDTIYKSISQILSHENDAWLLFQMPFYINLPTVLYGLNIIDNKDSAKFSFEKPNKEITDIDIEPVDTDIFYNTIFGEVKKGEEIPLYMKDRDKYYWYEYLEANKTIYFKYNSCREMKDQPFKEFSKELFDYINNKDVEKLVIDMRDNGGGSSIILNKFIKNLSKSKLNEDGKIFVIVGRNTFSSAILNTIDLKHETKAIFVGEPTAGKPNHYGEVKSFKLPNSKITVKYSTKYFNHYEEDIPSFIPDNIIELTIDDYINNNDPILNYILNNNI